MLSATDIQKSLYTPLKQLGLSEHEITLYCLSLFMGPVPITKLAETMNIPRPNVYKLIEGLEQHKLANFQYQKRRKKTFMVEPPTVIIELIRKKRETLNELDRSVVGLIPDLLALYRQGELPTSIKILEGKAEFEKAFDESLDVTKDISEFFGSTEDFITFITWEHEQGWIQKRVKKNLFIKVLSLPSKTAEALKSKDKLELRETRLLKMAAPFETSFQLFANKVIIWQPHAPLAILIEDEYIAKMLRSVFYALWEISK
jgi:sugar-specific transcriptional regulator TrmB